MQWRALLSRKIIIVLVLVVFFVAGFYLFYIRSNTLNERTSDQGKICNGSSECQGWCISDGIGPSGPGWFGYHISPEDSNYTGTCSGTKSRLRGCFCELTKEQNATNDGKYIKRELCMCVD